MLELRKLGKWMDRIPGELFPIANTDRMCEAPQGKIEKTHEHQNSRPDDEDMTEVVKARQAAEIHRQVRKYAQSIAKPGMTYYDLVEQIEAKTVEFTGPHGLNAGWGFPTGASINNCAAHWSPNPLDTDQVIKESDLIKIDFGVHIGGRIIDSAFTLSFDAVYDPLIEATLEATKVGVQESGIDSLLGEIGTKIQEVIESYEIELSGKTYKIKPVRNLNGHNITPYRIHGGKNVPLVKTTGKERMEENEFYAIETFATTGKGVVVDDGECSHFSKVPGINTNHNVKGAKDLFSCINNYFDTLPFCRRWLNKFGLTKHLLTLKQLVQKGSIIAFPPLCDIEGSYVSQSEHTLVIRPSCKEVLSVGDDY